MRSLFLSMLLISAALAGCVESGGPKVPDATDVYGNMYEGIASSGSAPLDAANVIGASASELQSKADVLALQWAFDAKLLTVLGLELKAGNAEGKAFTGPVPRQYTLFDKFPGDGLAPYWNFLYTSTAHTTEGECEFLFVHVTFNNFAAAYVFDPSQSSFGGDVRMESWTCGEGNIAGAQPNWSIDSNEASSDYLVTDDRFRVAKSAARGVLWAIEPAQNVDPVAGQPFNAVWTTLSLPNLSNPLDPDEFLFCSTSAGVFERPTNCYDESGIGSAQVHGQSDGDEPILKPESGSATMEFGFVFSGPQSSTFTFTKASHPTLVVDYTVPAESPYETATIQLRGPAGATWDTANLEKSPGVQNGKLTAEAPMRGDWIVRITGSAGTPSVQYRWCAEGFNPNTDQVIECA
jgi:hypothetical protein